MITEYISMTEEAIDAGAIERAGRILRAGGLVAFPTETVYGLGGDALNPESSRKIYAAKGRPSDNPLIVHICRMEDLPPIVREIPQEALRLAETCWQAIWSLWRPPEAWIPWRSASPATGSPWP